MSACALDGDVGQTERRGGGGGAAFSFDCGEDALLVGVRGLQRGALGGVAGLCQRIDIVDGAPALVGEVFTTAAAGGGDAEIDSVCPDGHAVVGFGGRAGLLMDAIVPSCAPVTVDADGSLLPGAPTVDADPVSGRDGGGDAFADATCAAFAVGVYGGAGNDLDGFGLRCGAHVCDLGVFACAADGAPLPSALAGNAGGGQPYDIGCGDGEILVGVRGLQRGSLGGVGAWCRAVEREGAAARFVGDAVFAGSTGAGDAEVDALCPADHGMVGFSGRAGALIDAIVPRCAPLGTDGATLAPGAPAVDGPAAGGRDGGGNAFQTIACAGFAVGIRGGAGNDLDSFGVSCGALVCE